MIINIHSYCGENAKIESAYTFSHVVAWSLRRAFEKQGVKTRFINDGQTVKWETLPEADHSIVISSFIAKCIRGSHEKYGKDGRRLYNDYGERILRDPSDKASLNEKIRKATKGKLCFYVDADYWGWIPPFDYMFSVVKPNLSKWYQYVYVGWGADPEYFYPGQGEKAVFIDSLMYGYYEDRFNDKYDIIKKVFNIPEETLTTGAPLVHETTVDGESITVYMPFPVYRRVGKKILWMDLQKIFRKCHYYCCTQLGESGLTRIESATCGGLLVVPKGLYRERTMGSLEYSIWETEEELIDIIMTETDPKAISQKALEHNWDKVATRILRRLRRS